MPLAPDEFVLDQPKGGEEFTLDMPKRRTPLESLARGYGLLNRATIEGAAAIPAAIADAPLTVSRSLGRPLWSGPSSQEALSNLLTRAGLPKPEGFQEQAMDFAAGAAVPMEGAVKLTDISKPGAALLSTMMRSKAKELVYSSLKPTLTAMKKGDAAKAIDTILEQGIPIGEKGVRVIRDKLDDLNSKIKDAIANSTETVKKSGALQNLQETLKRFERQVNPQADMEAIKRAWVNFRDHPLLRGSDDIPVQLAQELKQGTHRALAGKYGELGSAETEAQKAITRSLKDQVAEKVPVVAPWNKEESQLLATLPVVERAALNDLKKNPMSLSLLARNPAAAVAFLADRSPAFKTMAARMIYRGSGAVGGATQRGAGVLLYDLARQQRIDEIPQ